jgi:hypothetical protein
MACCSNWHKELDENGVGKCSVPMWMNGVPAGFCDEPAFGKYIDGESFHNPHTHGRVRFDGKYTGYVPYLACPGHGGPKTINKKYLAHYGDPCKYCGTPHDDVEPGPCPEHGGPKEN